MKEMMIFGGYSELGKAVPFSPCAPRSVPHSFALFFFTSTFFMFRWSLFGGLKWAAALVSSLSLRRLFMSVWLGTGAGFTPRSDAETATQLRGVDFSYVDVWDAIYTAIARARSVEPSVARNSPPSALILFILNNSNPSLHSSCLPGLRE